MEHNEHTAETYEEWWRDPRHHFGMVTADSALYESPFVTDVVNFVAAALDLRPGDRVLDVACGPGRYALEFAQRGHEVYGLDVNPDYIQAGQERAARDELGVTLRVGDMRDLSPWDDMDVILNIGTSFGFFTTERENRQVLVAVQEALAVGGRFFLEQINREWLMRNYLDYQEREEDGSIVVTQRRFDFVRGRNEVIHRRIRAGQPDEVWGHSWRAYTLVEMVDMLHASGLMFRMAYGDYDGRPYDLTSRRMIIVAEKRVDQ
ncbi:MAG: class I SAM-dependent methyltransferase [Chloroflexi bacterium]|nr:class I SAM-dependent methyltransferase [Chloroflexota bacterium]MBU1749922.1 class I SAM-dependent methyltransferase [Chloroflexota bacterium]